MKTIDRPRGKHTEASNSFDNRSPVPEVDEEETPTGPLNVTTFGLSPNGENELTLHGSLPGMKAKKDADSKNRNDVRLAPVERCPEPVEG